jgi:hypothetical protein
LRVEGVVDTQQRKEEFLRALAPVSNNPAVKIDIRTVAEATQRCVTTNKSVLVQEFEETLTQWLRTKIFARTSCSEILEAQRRIDPLLLFWGVSGRSYRALFHAIELKKHLARFANVDMRTVAPDARAKWLAMVRGHSTAFAREVATLRQELQRVFFPNATASGSEDVLIGCDAQLARAVERLYQLALLIMKRLIQHLRSLPIVLPQRSSQASSEGL